MPDSEINDDVAGSLVEDTENPSSVSERAQVLLGERFVDVQVSPDHSQYIVGVLNLHPDEVGGLEKRLSGPAPVTVVSRDVPRKEVEAARMAVENAVLKSDVAFTAISSDLQDGVVNLLVPTEKTVDQAASLVQSSLPGVQTVVPVEGGGSDIVVNPSEPSAIVEVRISDLEGKLTEEYSNTSPYRAGKFVAIDNGTGQNCTTSWLMAKNGNNFGSSAGHCGDNGSRVYFGGENKGDVQWNQFQAGRPNDIRADVLLFDLGNGGLKSLYRSTTINRDVTGKYAQSDMVSGWRTCTRGAFTGDQSCGDLKPNWVDVTFTLSGKTFKNMYCWQWEPANGYTNIPGDSGAPTYRVRANESVWAAGILSSIIDTDNDGIINASCFTGINEALTQLGANLQTQ
ncbi:MAG: S1 family peptidase [Actinomycetia bacterium]|nr:S1 family peptidase [Actinomycetes bacterium]